MKKTTRRDPRIYPDIGDVVLSHGVERTIIGIFGNGFLGWKTKASLSIGKMSLDEWRKWAQEGEIIKSGGESQAWKEYRP